MSVQEILTEHWQTYGRDYYSRHDYEALDSSVAAGLMEDLTSKIDNLAGTDAGLMTIARADCFSYHDPVDGSESHNQGIRVYFEGGARAVFRLSGTGTEGATLRVYLSAYAPPNSELHTETQAALAEVKSAAWAVAGMDRLGRDGPDVMT